MEPYFVASHRRQQPYKGMCVCPYEGSISRQPEICAVVNRVPFSKLPRKQPLPLVYAGGLFIDPNPLCITTIPYGHPFRWIWDYSSTPKHMYPTPPHRQLPNHRPTNTLPCGYRFGTIKSQENIGTWEEPKRRCTTCDRPNVRQRCEPTTHKKSM